MGLQNNLTDVSSDSIPLMLLALIACCVNYLRLFFFRLLHGGSYQLEDGSALTGDTTSVGSELSEQLNINRLFSYSYRCGVEGVSCEASDCVVCLCRLMDGDQVRRLDCSHVFHKECFDGWLDHFNFNCPICRSPLVADESVKIKEQSIGGNLTSRFSLH